MKRKILYVAVVLGMVAAVLCISSCRDSRSDGYPVPGCRNAVEWEMVLGGGDTGADTGAYTRAVVGSDGSGRFEYGDTVVMCARNVADGSVRSYTLRLSAEGWVPRIYWSEVGSEVEFTAWHASEAVGLHEAALRGAEYIHLLSADQQKSYDASDLLCARARVRAGEAVRLEFGHALSRLNIRLESRDASFTDEELQQAQIGVLTPCRVTFDLKSGALLTFSDYAWVAPARDPDTGWTALLCPQTSESMGPEGWIRVRVGGRETTVSVPETVGGIPFTGLEAGKELTYRLNMLKSDDTYAGTTRWVYGVREPAGDDWNSDGTQLAWTEGCGWFDCNKVNPSGTSAGSDGLMCWAAATSNLLHWWLQQNGDTAAVQAYNGPAAVPSDMLHSEIFQLFKAHFPNAGDYPLKAVNWFFNGVFHKRIYDTDAVDPAAGFFREQLGTRSLGAEYVGTDMKRDRFNAIVRQALESRQGILFVVNMGRAWTTHAVTLWGVKFDEEGLIDTLYMVDNNDGRSDARGTMRTMPVRYLPYSDTNADLYPYVPNSVGDFAIRIESLCTLSLGRDVIM